MSVRFQYAGDKDISASRASGASVFKLPVIGGSFPEYGTLIETLYLEPIPTANGGLTLEINGTYYLTQTATVNRIADGVGGSLLDWPNAYDVNYVTNGTTITSVSGYTTVEIDANYYNNGEYTTTYFHSGEGSYYSDTTSSYYPYGTYLTDTGSGSNSISTPVGSYTYESWDNKLYYTDGGSGYYVDTINYASSSYGDYIGNDGTSGSNSTEVPSGSYNYFSYETWTSTDYYYDGSSNYYVYRADLTSASYGDFITNDGTYDYYWDGSGGYYY